VTIGTITIGSLSSEHMEEDEESSKAIPKWVELEYKVRRIDEILDYCCYLAYHGAH
jgi:hypothetical protein